MNQTTEVCSCVELKLKMRAAKKLEKRILPYRRIQRGKVGFLRARTVDNLETFRATER